MNLLQIVGTLDTSPNAQNRCQFLDWFEYYVIQQRSENTTLWFVAQEPEMAMWCSLCKYISQPRTTFTKKTAEYIFQDMKKWLLEAIRANYIVE